MRESVPAKEIGISPREIFEKLVTDIYSRVRQGRMIPQDLLRELREQAKRLEPADADPLTLKRYWAIEAAFTGRKWDADLT